MPLNPIPDALEPSAAFASWEATEVPNPDTPVDTGSPVQLVKVPLDGVPKTGVVSVGLVKVLLVSVSVVALPTSVSVAAGKDRVTVPSAPVTGERVTVPEVAFLKSTEPTNEPATPRVTFDVPSV